MSKEATSKVGSSYPDSVSFPNTVIQSTPFGMGSKVFRFEPIKSDVLLKQLLEDEEESLVSSDDDANILDQTITEENLVPGVHWLENSPDRKPLKIISKQVPSTPKEPRSISVDRKDEHKLPQTSANNNLFKTPICKNSRHIPGSSTAQKLYSSDRNAIQSVNNQPVSVRKRLLETPKQKLPIQANKNLETPRHTSILQAAIHRNYNTPRPTLPSATKEDRIVSSSAKKSDVVLREKNINLIGLQRQRSREVINEEKHLTNSGIKHVPNKSNISEIRQPLNNHSSINEERQHSNKQSNNTDFKQSNINDARLLPNKQSSISTPRQFPNKQSNSNEFKQSTINEERQIPNKQRNCNELKQTSISESRHLTNRQLQSNEFKQSDVSEERQLTNKHSNSNEFKQSAVNEERQISNKQRNSNELKQSVNNEEKQMVNKQSNNNDFKQSGISEPRQLTNKQLQINEFKQSDISEEKQLTNKHSNSNEFKQSIINEEIQMPNKQWNSNELKQSSNNEEKQLINKQSNSNDLKHTSNNEQRQIQNKQKNHIEIKQPNVQIKIPAKSLQESTFQQLKVKGKEYILINKIGEGGSGQVYRCLEQETLQDRAIKIVNLNVDAATRNSYMNEVTTLKKLQKNDRVIRMYEYEETPQNLFVVMEKGDIDFSMFLRKFTIEPQIQTHVIVCYWIEMLKCVREIHREGIIHSDLKPSNFLLVGGRLKLIDFGIASRLNADMTSVIKNVTVGTFNYISPEALLDSRESPTADEKPQLRISFKSDVWSLGCILYQMVYKRTPFQSVGNMYAKFAMITNKNHKIEYHETPGVPSYLIDMIKMCLVYDMRNRPTVEELLKMYYKNIE